MLGAAGEPHGAVGDAARHLDGVEEPVLAGDLLPHREAPGRRARALLRPADAAHLPDAARARPAGARGDRRTADEDVSWQREWEHFARRDRRRGATLLRRLADARYAWAARRGRLRGQRSTRAMREGARSGEPRARHRRLAGNRPRGRSGARRERARARRWSRAEQRLFSRRSMRSPATATATHALDVCDEAAWQAVDRRTSSTGSSAPRPCSSPIGPIDDVRARRVRAHARDQRRRHGAGRRALPAGAARGDGSVVTFSGGGATGPLPRFDAYAASKAAVVRLTREPRDDAGPDRESTASRPGSSPRACTTRRSRPVPRRRGRTTTSARARRSRRRASRRPRPRSSLPCFSTSRAVHRQADLGAVGPVARYRVSRGGSRATPISRRCAASTVRCSPRGTQGVMVLEAPRGRATRRCRRGMAGRRSAGAVSSYAGSGSSTGRTSSRSCTRRRAAPS